MEYRDMRRLARNEFTGRDRLVELAHLGPAEVRADVALHPATPLETLESLAEDRSVDVRIALAHRPDLASHVRARLMRDRAAVVREAAAGVYS